jgi:hypothetical protein
MNSVVPVKTFDGVEKKTVRWCIENHVVAEGMTLEECNQSVDGEFTMLTKLEKDWAIYIYKDSKIWVKGDVVSTTSKLQAERLRDTLEYMRKEREKNPIWIR